MTSGTPAPRCLQLGVPLEVIQDVIGRSSPTVAKVSYVDVAEDVTRDAVDRLDFLFVEQNEE